MRKTLITFLIFACLLNIGVQIYSAFFIKNGDQLNKNNQNKEISLDNLKNSWVALYSIVSDQPTKMPKIYNQSPNYPVPDALTPEQIQYKNEEKQVAVQTKQVVEQIINNTIPNLQENKQESKNENLQFGMVDQANLKCLVWGPLVDDTLTQAQLLMETYEDDFKNKLKRYEFDKKNLWYVVMEHSVADWDKPNKIKIWQANGINVEKLIFLNDGRAWINTFTDQNLANQYVAGLKAKKIPTILIPDQKSEVYYYMIDPDEKYSARMRAFGLYFSDTQTIETNCLDNKDLSSMHDKFVKN